MSIYAIKRFIIKTMKLDGYISSYRLRPDLPNYLSQVLIGLLLSDGSLEKPLQKGGVRFSLNLSFNNASLLFHVYNLFEPYVNGFPNIVKVIPNRLRWGHKDKEFDSIRFKTVILPNLVNYYDRFYQFRSEKGKIVKVLPLNIMDIMTPIVLAYMIMGDGNYHKGKNIIRIYTNNFTKAEVDILADVLYRKLSINARVQHDRRQQYIIVIDKNQIDIVRELVLPYMHPCMMYRIGLINTTNKFNYENILKDI